MNNQFDSKFEELLSILMKAGYDEEKAGELIAGVIEEQKDLDKLAKSLHKDYQKAKSIIKNYQKENKN